MSGTRNNKGKMRWRNLPLFLLEDVIKIGEVGEKNHSTFNFLKGFPINDTLDSLKRHLNLFESPYESDFDEETKINHLAHIAWNALAALHTYKNHPEMDDRYKTENKVQLSLDKEALEPVDLNKDHFIKETSEMRDFAINKMFENINSQGYNTSEFIKIKYPKTTEQNVKEAAEEVASWPEWKKENIKNTFSETLKISKENYGLDKNRFLDFSNDKGIEQETRCRGSMSGKPSACGCGDCS